MIIEVPFSCFRFVLAALLLTVLTHTQALGGVIDLNVVAAATATDDGPKTMICGFGDTADQHFNSKKVAA